MAHVQVVFGHMGRHHFEHDDGGGAGIFDIAQLAIAVAAVVIAGAAYWFTRRESIRAGNRERLRWMHEALNQLKPLQEHALAPHETEYAELQQWLKTSLAVAGARERLPLTMALAERAMPAPDEREEMTSEVNAAREELLAALETDGDLAAAGKRLK